MAVSGERARIEDAIETVVVARGYPDSELAEVCALAGVGEDDFRGHFR